ncbi:MULTISPECIES: sulfite oxidase-like oxidoreductase [unclassified Roseofilum]|uniref:sulfite oxidase-like oxidoreductase n=1 Tax=unclassified Roseofilum TaxID=2620099 RepID=UPI000E94EE6A|nr:MULTISPECIES: sulfite oxidase-like oxidoreductase [unclassified Roseofilum]HBQ97158.1 sulfite oxidase-like oxidoreductase [Cyanobacteria bacterium UBA11691]MBP0007721.1 sulfite oxidase-like oxidoreductase [Roseofilum sp. Belize Diploria]MBP0012478.1 sulfite oxidase-like oxidoreductase [Roseofilum sp. SID3]MBP0025126.1 sulfite oxidase-like oxidoreductase [Roseofilum sp. SID2]MBP0031625.1 sulfite oxidase-like oxidoreductase [Roseofilum sp. Belize BBD 4]
MAIGKFFSKPDPSLQDRTPPGQHLSKGFPVLTYGETPEVTADAWQLKVWGLAKEVSFTFSDLMAMPQHDFTKDFHCVTHWSKLDVQWRGVRVMDFMKQVDLDPKTTHLMQHAYGGYTTNLTLEDFLKEDNFFAHTLFGEPLSADHGGPVRLVIPHLYAWKSTKWIHGLEFLDREELGFWESNGYHRRGEPWAQERYSNGN